MGIIVRMRSYSYLFFIIQGIRINTHITIPNSLVLSSYDMNILLGNIMQNAIDAAEKYDGTISFTEKNGLFTVSVLLLV